MNDLETYFDRDEITCLICGNACVQLAAHIAPAHGISSDDYKERFGIPWSYGLAGKTFRQKASRRMKAMRRTGKLPQAPSADHIRKLIAASKRRRPPVDATRNDSRRKLLAVHGREEKWSPSDFAEYLRRIASGRTPAEVGRDKDMPGRDTFDRYVDGNPDFKKQYEKVWDRLPYSVQVRASKLGKQFQQDVVRLRRQDMTWAEIGAALGVTAAAARNTWHQLKKRGKLSARDLEHEYKRYTHRHYEEYLRRIASGRSVTEVGHDKGMPPAVLFHKHIRENPRLKRRYEKILDALPYDIQARSRMGNRFRREVARLRKKDHSWPAIGRMLGVHPSTASRAWRS
jgi:hypothetical protein